MTEIKLIKEGKMPCPSCGFGILNKEWGILKCDRCEAEYVPRDYTPRARNVIKKKGLNTVNHPCDICDKKCDDVLGIYLEEHRKGSINHI